MKYVFYDTETTGTAKAFDQILQFAAVVTDADLNEVDRFEIRSRLEPHIIAHPGALVTNGITVDKLFDPSLPSHYEMVCKIRERLTAWCPAIFIGYNSIKFDEELLRHAFFKTLHPPYLTSKSGNGRADAMTLVQIAAAFVPECLTIPCDGSGKAIYKLDQVAPTNGFNHENAHDALGDVLATIHLARCVKERAPECWKRFIRFSNKAAVAEFIESQSGFLLTEFYYNKPYHFPVGYVDTDPDSANTKVCLDLRHDPAWIKSLSDPQLVALASKSPKPIRRVKSNSSPLIADLAEVPSVALHGFTIETLRQRADQIRADLELQSRILKAFAETKSTYEESAYWEEKLYGQFSSAEDEQKMEAFHAAPWPARAAIVESFSDERLRYFGRQLLHAHCREVLPESLCAELEAVTSSRLLEMAPPKDKWTSIPGALAAANQMLENAEGPVAELLSGYVSYLTARAAELA